MNSLEPLCPPVLSCAAARDLEARLFEADEARELAAMEAAGRAIAAAVLRDFEEIGGFPANARILVLAGKGHNGGDAMIAARSLLERFPGATASVLFAFGARSLRPLAARAWRELAQSGRDRAAQVRSPADGEWTLVLDGVFGFQFRPPADQRVSELLAKVNELRVSLRAAVDLPSAGLFRAHFTYATGSVKEPLLGSETAGRVRYLDLGFFADPAGITDVPDRVLTPAVLEPLRRLRPASCDKRTFGNVFLLGGSRGLPGAILMAAMAAVRSGAGLVTVFVPETLVPAYAARLPEAMWVGWPETPAGSLALEGEHLLRERLARADAIVMGPGMGREAETLALAKSVMEQSEIPVVLDADALQPGIVNAGHAARIVTPHAGEFARISGGMELREFAANPHLTVVLKGPVTRLSAGGPVFHSFFGGPVLARGGSGDILAGMIGAQVAQAPQQPVLAAARAVVWHGLAADHLARTHGQVAVRTTQLLDHLGEALRSA